MEKCVKLKRKELEEKWKCLPILLLNNIPQFVYKLILLIVQYTLKYALVICTFLSEFRRIYAVSTRRFAGGLTIDHLQRDLGNLSKLPRHMSFVINEDVDPDYCDLINLIVWTIAMGIPYITIYERHGLLKAGESRLGRTLACRLRNFLGSERSKTIEVVVKHNKAEYANGMTYPKRVCVQLLSEMDGKPDMVNAARSIIKDVKGRQMGLKDIDIDKVSSRLLATKGLPDPDLALQFGKIQSMMGYPPWQTRLTEIVSLPSYKKLTYEKYYEVLQRFDNCKQRFGK